MADPFAILDGQQPVTALGVMGEHLARLKAAKDPGPQLPLRDFIRQAWPVVGPRRVIFGWYVDARVSAGIGVIYLIARIIYRNAYIGDPKNRAAGFGIGALCMGTLVIGGAVGAALDLM